MLSKNLPYRIGNSRLLSCQMSDALGWELARGADRMENLLVGIADCLVDEILTGPEQP